jgi:Fe-S cluster biogenesis protein NfuA
MIKKLHITRSLATAAMAIFMLLPGLGWGQIIISQVYEGASNNKWIEVTNVGSSTVDLASPIQYKLGIWSVGGDAGNGAISGNPSSSVSLSGTLAPGGIYLMKNASSSTTVPHNPMPTANASNTTVCGFNGNDALAIFTGTNTIVDAFGVGINNKDISYHRNSNIVATNSTFTVSEWTLKTLAEVAAATNLLSEYISTHIYTPASTPTITLTGSFTPFSTSIGTPSASQPVAVSGSNLTSTIEVASLTGYEYSTNDAAPWTTTLSLASSYNGNVYVRLTGASVGSPSGTISFTSTGATQVDKAVTGVVNPLTPVINVTGTFIAFSTIVGTPSASQSVAVTGSNLTSTIEISAVAEFEYSTTNAAPWTTTLSLASSFNGIVHVRLTGTSIGSPSGTISFTSTGATQVDKAVSGSVTAPPLMINVTGTFSAFSTIVGTPSISKYVTVSGSNLTSNIDVSAVTGYEYSTDNLAPWTSTLSLASSFNGNVYVRLTGASLGSPSGTISFTSTGATQVDKAVSGTVSAPAPSLPLYENFNFTDNSLLTANGWVAHSGAASSPIAVGASNGLSYTGYSGVSGITGVVEGNAAKLITTGEDDSKIFNAVTSGSIYFSFLTNVTTGTDGYYIHLGASASSFAARIYVKPSATPGKINFGISNTTASYAATPSDFDPGVTYLLIVKYDVSVTGEASLWIKAAGVPSDETAAGTAECTTTGGGQASIDRICLRQYVAAQSMVVDGIRVGTLWADIIPPTTTTFSNTGDWSASGNWSNGIPTSAMDAIIDGNVTVDVAAETKNLTIINYQTVTISDTKSLTVNGTLTNSHGTFGLVINPGGQLKNNTAGVDATVNLNVTGGALWHLFCLPITTGITASPFFDQAYIDEYLEASAAWSRLGNASTVNPNTGYSINYEVTTPLAFTGTLNNNAGQSLSGLSFSEINGDPDYEGWHLLGNTFTCGIDAALISATGDVNGSVYVWDEGGSGNYLPYSINGGGAPNGTIAPMQGFFVKVTTSTNTLNIPTSAKTIGGSFLKSISNNEMLTLSIAGNNYSDKTYVGFNPEATANFDQAFDAYKRSGIDAAPQLYSIIPGEKAAVNTLPDYNTNPNVPLGLKVGAATTYTLTVEGISSFDPQLPIRLDDLKLGTSQDLRAYPTYSFTASPGDAENRFRLRFASATGVDENDANGFQVMAANGTIRITHDKPANGMVYLYSVSAQLLAASELNAGETTLQCTATGVYLVKVVTETSTFTRKIAVVK